MSWFKNCELCKEWLGSVLFTAVTRIPSTQCLAYILYHQYFVKLKKRKNVLTSQCCANIPSMWTPEKEIRMQVIWEIATGSTCHQRRFYGNSSIRPPCWTSLEPAIKICFHDSFLLGLTVPQTTSFSWPPLRGNFSHFSCPHSHNPVGGSDRHQYLEFIKTRN